MAIEFIEATIYAKKLLLITTKAWQLQWRREVTKAKYLLQTWGSLQQKDTLLIFFLWQVLSASEKKKVEVEKVKIWKATNNLPKLVSNQNWLLLSNQKYLKHMFSKVWVEMFQLGDVTLFPFIKRNLVSSTDYKLFLKNDCVNKQYFHPPPPPPQPLDLNHKVYMVLSLLLSNQI